MNESGKSMFNFTIMSKDKQGGHQSLWGLASKWRAGTADDTITVVIYSKLPVLCHVQLAHSLQ